MPLTIPRDDFPFPPQDVYDKVDYLSSLGKTQTAVVQRDADIGVAEAERDAGIRVCGLAFPALGTRERRGSGNPSSQGDPQHLPLLLPGSRVQEGDAGCEVHGRHQDRRLQASL